MPLGPVPLSDDTASGKAARANWAQFITKVFAAEPVVCPDCGGVLKVISLSRIRAILLHLALCHEPRAALTREEITPVLKWVKADNES